MNGYGKCDFIEVLAVVVASLLVCGVMALLFILPGCARDVSITNTNELTAQQSQACGEPNCEFEKEECPHCFDPKFLAESTVSFETCLDKSGC